jgi:hypothetical protein
MPDGHFPDVELLRRELAALILEWAGKAVKDDPDGPLSTALTRAVGEAARGAVAEQHQALSADAADRIAEAIERRDQVGSRFLWRASPLALGLLALAVVGLVVIAFLLGLQAGGKDSALPTAPTASAAPIAPFAPAADDAAASPSAAPSSTPRVVEPRPTARPQRAERAPAKSAAKSAARPTPRELGRPAPSTDEASPRSTQPVGAAAKTPAAPTPGTTP